MVSEPEAAAIHVLRVMRSDLKPDDAVVVCDAGGGTLDLITYIIQTLGPVSKLKEASPGIGATCGAAILNLRFRENMKKMLSKQPGWGDHVLEAVGSCMVRR